MSKKHLKKNLIIFAYAAGIASALGIIFILIAGLSYSNPNLSFIELFQKDPFIKLLHTFLPLSN